MQEKKLETYLYFILLAIALYLTFSIFSPYLYTLSMALIFAVLFYPFFKKTEVFFRKHNSLAAMTTVLAVVIIVLIPMTFFGLQLSDEVKNIYDSAFSQSDGVGIIGQLTSAANNYLSSFSPFGLHWPVFQAADTESYVLNFLAWLRGHFGDIFSGLANIFIHLFLFTIAFFYFLRDGDDLRKAVIFISPFRDDRDEMILQKLRLSVLSVVKGSIFVAILQGILTGIGFFVFGIPGAALWGGVSTLAALIPGVGGLLVLLPGIIYLVFIGQFLPAIGLTIWSVITINFVFNFLGPKLIGRGIKIHPLLVLLSALGGISFFGPTGFILGPITLSFLFTLLDIYKTVIVKDNLVQ